MFFGEYVKKERGYFMDSILFLILLQVILILFNAIFVSAEIAVLSINEMKIEHMAQEGNTRAKRLFHLKFYRFIIKSVSGFCRIRFWFVIG